MIGELVVTNQGTVGLAARRTEFVFVKLLEEVALVELGRLVEVFVECPLVGVEHANLQRLAGLAVHHQVTQSPPGAFQLLELGVMHDLLDLGGDRVVDGGDGPFDGVADVLVERDGPFLGLFDQGPQQFLGPVGLGLPGVTDRHIENAGTLLFGFGGLSSLGLRFRTHRGVSSLELQIRSGVVRGIGIAVRSSQPEL